MGARIMAGPKTSASASGVLGLGQEPAPNPTTLNTAAVREGGAPGNPGGPIRRAPIRLGLVGLRGRACVMAPDMGHGSEPDGAETGPSSVQAAPAEGIKAT